MTVVVEEVGGGPGGGEATGWVNMKGERGPAKKGRQQVSDKRCRRGGGCLLGGEEAASAGWNRRTSGKTDKPKEKKRQGGQRSLQAPNSWGVSLNV